MTDSPIAPADAPPDIEDGGKWNAETRRWALQTAAEIYGAKPGERILELADLLHRFDDEGRKLPPQAIVLAAAAATRLSPEGLPGEPSEIIVWARIFRDYVKTGDLPEPPSEAP